MIHFGPSFQRPSSQVLALYRELPVATVSDVLGPGYVMNARVKPLAAGMRLLGPAFTLQLPLMDNLGMHVAVKEAQAGDVIVCDQQGAALAASVGEIMACSARQKQLAGIVLDGSVRDAAKLRESAWAIFAVNVSAQQCRKDGPAWLGFAITCAGVRVRPGDIVLGDDDGVVVIPADRAEAVACEAAQKVVKESLRIAAITQGSISPAWLDEAIQRAGILAS